MYHHVLSYHIHISTSFRSLSSYIAKLLESHFAFRTSTVFVSTFRSPNKWTAARQQLEASKGSRKASIFFIIGYVPNKYIPKYMSCIWVFPEIGTPKWMVYSGNPYQNGWFGGTTIFGNTHIRCIRRWLLKGPPSQGYHHFSYENCFCQDFSQRFMSRRFESGRHVKKKWIFRLNFSVFFFSGELLEFPKIPKQKLASSRGGTPEKASASSKLIWYRGCAISYKGWCLGSKEISQELGYW